MDPDATKKFLLVQALEESDSDGSLIPLDERQLRESEATADAIVSRRSERLYEGLAAAHPGAVGAAMAATGSHRAVQVAIVLGAVLIGLATKQLGPERMINVLAFPLLGVLGWNVLVYLVGLGRAVLRKPSVPGLGGALGRLARSLSQRSVARLAASGEHHRLAEGLSRFIGRWHELAAGAQLARARGCLHLAAAALSIGVIAGMYWNGLAFQYRATWESTFLSPEGVRGLFSVLFAPASALSGIAVPGIEQIRAMELATGEAGAPAAGWIHLFAITVGLFVVAPRLLMAWRLRRQAAAVEAQIDPRQVAKEYLARLLRTREGGKRIARLVPHRIELGSKARDRLRAFLHRLWGGQLWVEFADPIGYGDEDEAEFAAADYQVLVMNFSSTPEDESQGRLVRRFCGQLEGVGLVLLEVAPFRERFGGLGEFERRLAERRAAWEAVLGRAGARFAVYDVDFEPALAEARRAELNPQEDLHG